ncbi:hypothetical protein EDD16DRAFT_1719769 [Pisolithus croceorrhizus]|nr:hypothetical protein EDD16DRAFT_1719769 [Pisolithus croceorrhizus]KAI6166417.1 hypothetical protein EDD17DRAFT_1753276 [Pisolithus thermaeus]
MFGGEGVYWIRNKSLSSKFIDVCNNPYVHSGGRGSMPIGLLSTRLTRPQLWLAEQVQDGESYIFRNYDTGSVLDIQSGSSTGDAPIVVQPYKFAGEDASSQHWRVVWVSDDNKIPYYCITNQKAGTVLDQTRNTKNGANFSVESTNFCGGQHQLWSFERATFPTMYWLVNLSSQRCLQYSPNSGDTTTMDVQTKFPSRNQLWYLESLVDYGGYYRIRHVGSEDRVLDLSGKDNTSILTWPVHRGSNQRWKITDIDMNGVVSITCGKNDTVLHAKPDREGVYCPRGTTDACTFNSRYQWCLIPCPIPSLFWTAVQCRGSGMFVAQSGGSITASNGPRGETDYTVQWRFVTQGRNPYFTINNRRTGNSLYNPSGSSLAADTNAGSDKYYWSLDAGGEDYSITNLSTSNVIAWNNGNIQALSGGATDTNRQWFINASLQSVPSFTLINGRTSMALAYVPNVASGSVVMDGAFNSYRCHWIFQQVGTDTDDRPIYVIINKLSDNVLGHQGGVGIEALNNDHNDPHHQWRLVPCHKRYFAFVNVSTGKYLYDHGTVPNAGDAVYAMTDEDRRCCWTLVSHRDSVYDTITLDSDITVPYQKSHHIVKKAPKKLPKGKGNAKAQPSHIPNNPRIIQMTNRVLQTIVERLIGQIDFDRIDDQNGRPLASTSGTEVVKSWGIDIPRSIQVGWERDGWVRIDLQGTYFDQNGIRMANVQGQWNNDT